MTPMTQGRGAQKLRRALTALIFFITAVFYLKILSSGSLSGDVTSLTGSALSPRACHLVSLLLHALNAALLFLVALKVLPTIKSDVFGADKSGKTLAPFITFLPALLSALLFALHPVNVEAVSWIPATAGVLKTSFLFLSVLFFLSSRDEGASVSRDIVISILFFLLFAFFLLTENSFKGIASSALSMNIFPLFFLFITKLVVPMNLSVVYESLPVTSLLAPGSLSGLFLSLLFIFLFFFFRKSRGLPLAIALIVLPLLPALFGAGDGRELFVERNLYLSSAGFALFMAYWYIWFTGEVVARHKKRGEFVLRILNLFVTLPLFAALIIFSLNSTARMDDWKDELTLWLSAVANDKESAYAHYNAALLYKKESKLPAALWHFQNAARLDTANSLAFFNIGSLMAGVRRFDAAIHYYKLAISVEGEVDDYHIALARAYMDSGENASAVRVLEKLLKKSPELKEAPEMLKEARSRQ